MSVSGEMKVGVKKTKDPEDNARCEAAGMERGSKVKTTKG